MNHTCIDSSVLPQTPCAACQLQRATVLAQLPEPDKQPELLPPLLCTECGKPIEPFSTAVALRFTVVNDRANWAQRYEHRPLPGAFHGGCAEAAFRRNAEALNKPDPWRQLGEWLADRGHGPNRSWNRGRGFGGSFRAYLSDTGVNLSPYDPVAQGEGPTLDDALVAALEKLK